MSINAELDNDMNETNASDESNAADMKESTLIY